MNKNIKIETAVGIILLLAIVIGGLFWMQTEKKLTNESSQINIKQNQKIITDSFQDWKTYKNSSIGLQFKVPADWKILSVSDARAYGIGQTNPHSSVFVGVTDISNGETAESLLKQYAKRQAETNMYGGHPWEIYNLKTVSVAGLSGIAYENNPDGKFHKKSLEIPKDNKLLRIDYSYDPAASADIFDNIISTAKFSDSTAEGIEPSIIAKIGSSNKEMIIDDLHFTLPNNWIVAKEENGRIYIKDLGYKTKYDVFLIPSQISKKSTELDNYGSLETTDGEITKEAVGGAIAGYLVNIGGFQYEIIFDVDGDEPYPADVDGVWRPSHSFSDDKIEMMVKTASIK